MTGLNRVLGNRLILQLVFTLVAAISVVTLSVLLITEAIGSAERVVLGEANKTVASALRELRQQYQYRASSDSSWSELPMQARDVSLRGITQTVLRSYPGVEGGFYAGTNFLGYAFPTHDTGSAKIDVPSAERDLIISLTDASHKSKQLTGRVVRGRSDLLVLSAIPIGEGTIVAWVMKRLVGRAATGSNSRSLLLSILILAALVSIAGTLTTGLSFARGVKQIKQGLAVLKEDFSFRFPERPDEFGSICKSINQMAVARGKLEVELRREDRLRALGRLTAGVAHEIRNPLNSIRLTVQLLERRLEANSIRREDLQTVRAEVDRLSGLLNDLLDLQGARQPRPEMQPVLPIVEHCINLVERQAEMQNASICLERPQEDLRGYFDAQQLTQTVMNLLLNALEASSTGGTVHVRTMQEKAKITIEVEDQGTGLDSEQLQHLFEPFYTTKPAGTGLGLAVSRELMRSQGGDLHYVSGAQGARFVVALPSQ